MKTILKEKTIRKVLHKVDEDHFERKNQSKSTS